MGKRLQRAHLLKSSATHVSLKHISVAAPRPKACQLHTSGTPKKISPSNGRPRMSILQVDNIHTYYGNIHALKGVTLNVEKGEIVTLIGGNGAGKTTTLRTISGLLRPREGRVNLNDEDLLNYKPHEIVYKGISMVPEGRGIFARLSVT